MHPNQPNQQNLPNHDEHDEANPHPTTWGQRHAASILTGLLLALMALVILVQVAC